MEDNKVAFVWVILMSTVLGEVEKRIIGGSELETKGLFAQISYKKANYGSMRKFCGGTVFMGEFLLTHADCVPTDQSLIVEFNEMNDTSGVTNGKTRLIGRNHIFISDNTDGNGIALIKIPGQTTSLALCEEDQLPFGTPLAIVGMQSEKNEGGASSENASMSPLQLRVIETKEYARGCTEEMVCTIAMTASSTCRYDKGSPLLKGISSNHAKDAHCLYGVVKQSVFKCGWDDESVRLSQHKDWIQSVVSGLAGQ